MGLEPVLLGGSQKPPRPVLCGHCPEVTGLLELEVLCGRRWAQPHTLGIVHQVFMSWGKPAHPQIWLLSLGEGTATG